MLGVGTCNVELVGGVRDGLKIALHNPSEWLWVSSDGVPFCYEAPQLGTVPYRSVPSARPVEQRELVSYLYAGHAFTRCEGCGALHAVRDETGTPVPACHLCGHGL